MIKSDTETEFPDAYKDWWDLKQHKAFKPYWIEACDRYVKKKHLDLATLEFNDNLVIDMLSEIGKSDERFKWFPKADFCAKRFNTHRALYNTVQARLEKMKLEDEQFKQELLAKEAETNA